jgi:hypothetical protein
MRRSVVNLAQPPSHWVKPAWHDKASLTLKAHHA